MKRIRAILIMLLITLPAFPQEESVNMILDEFLFGKHFPDSMLDAIDINEEEIYDLIGAINNYKYLFPLRKRFNHSPLK